MSVDLYQVIYLPKCFRSCSECVRVGRRDQAWLDIELRFGGVLGIGILPKPLMLSEADASLLA